MKKIISIVFVFIFSFLSFAEIPSVPTDNNITIKDLMYPADKVGPFFPISGSKYLIPTAYEYDDYLNKLMKKKTKNKKVEVPLSYFSKMGLIEGTTIQFFNFETGSANTYTFKKTVKAQLIENPNYNMSEENPGYYYGKVFILLSDSWDGVEEAKSLGGGDQVTGLAYVGNDYKFKNTVPVSPIELSDASSDEFYKNLFKSFYATFKDKTFALSQIKKSRLLNLEFIFSYGTLTKGNDTDSTVASVIKYAGNFYHLNSVKEDVRAGSYIEGVDAVILQPQNDMHSCDEVMILKDKKIHTYKLFCDSGGC